jgi:hypothetical protein
MALGGADEALRGRGGSDTAEPDAGAFSEGGPGSEAPAGPERDVDIGTPFLGGAANSRRSDEWRYRTISSLGVALDDECRQGERTNTRFAPRFPMVTRPTTAHWTLRLRRCPTLQNRRPTPYITAARRSDSPETVA